MFLSGFLRALAGIVFCFCLCGAASASDAYLDNRLLAASSRGDTRIVKDSLLKGANIDSRDRLGNTPLILASDGGYQEIVRLLIEEGAAVNAMNVYGYTPLLSAVTNSHRYIASLLFKAGADPEIPNKYGTTPSMYIKTLGFFTMNEYAGLSGPALSSLTDDRPERRGAAGGLHNPVWRERFNMLLSEGKAKEAVDILVKTAETGNRHAMFLLGSLLIERNNISSGISWLKKAAAGADADILYETGRLLAGGSVPYDRDFGMACLKRAMEGGSAEAEAEYARLVLYGGDYAEAYPIFVSAAERGSLEGAFYQGYMLFAGKGVKADEEKGLSLINKAASGGYGEAEAFLGRLGLEDMIRRVASSSVGDRAMIKGDILSLNAHLIKGREGCDTYGLEEAFGGAYGVRRAEICYPGDGTVKAFYYMAPSADRDGAAYLKNTAGNAEFVFP